MNHSWLPPYRPWLLACLLLLLLLPGMAVRVQAYPYPGGTYIKEGVKHYYLTGYSYTLSPGTTWAYDPADSDPYAKVKIHICTQSDIENDGGCYDDTEEVWCWDGDGDPSNCDCSDNDDYITDDDNPSESTFYVSGLTIEEGMQVEIADDVTMVVTGALVVNGTEQKPVSIDVGARLEINGVDYSGTGDLDWCQIRSGSGTYGGGLYLNQTASFTLTNSSVTNNQADYGGGIYIYGGGTGTTIENTEISGNNNVSLGGGLYISNSAPTIRDCLIKSNTNAWRGGGLYVSGGSPTIVNTRICDNSAQYGGGVYADGSATPLFVNSMICNNLATSAGGGLYLSGASPRIVSGVICENVIKGTDGGGMYGSSAAPTVTNTIVYGNLISWYDNQPEELYTYQQLYPAALAANFTRCDIQGQAAGGTNCIDAVPGFAGAPSQKGPDGRGADADWSLAADSPCINTGTANDLATAYDDADAAGNARPYNKPAAASPYADAIRVDIGAYEYQNNPPLLLDGSGNPVFGDIHSTAATDEDSDATITLFAGYDVVDVDGDTVTTVITEFPDDVLGDNDDPAVVEYGQLFQFLKGDAITAGDNTVTDSSRQVVFTPANRISDYSASLTGSFSDGESPSTYGNTVAVSVTAGDDRPDFTSSPALLVIYAGEQFDYSVTAENPDVDDLAPPTLSIETLPDWLSFWDNGDGSGGLLGIASDDDVGDTEITLIAEDDGGNGNTQTFTVTVQEQVALEVTVESSSVSAAPGDTASLRSSSSTLDTNPSFDWVITDENNVTVATLSGQNVSWDTTGQAEGIYSAEVTISDNRGSTTDSKIVTVSLAAGFSQTDDDNRAAPTAAQADTIDNLDGSESASLLNDLAALDLSPAQRDKVAAAIAAKSDDSLTATEVNQLAGALDNLVIADPSEAGEYLAAGQVDDVLDGLGNLAARSDLTEMQLVKLAETADELIGQQGRDNLSADQLAAVAAVRGDLIRAAAGSDRVLTAGGGDFGLASQPVDAATTAPLVLKTGGATATIYDVAELRARSGRTSFCLIFTHNTASELAAVPVYRLGLYTRQGDRVTLAEELDTPVEMTLPVSADSRTEPMRHDDAVEQWDNAVIYDPSVADGVVTYETTRLGSYGLFGPVVSPAEATSGAAAGGSSSSNCFVRTLVPGW